MSRHLRTVDVTDGVQQVVGLINDDNTACHVNATCLAGILMQKSVVRDHYYLCKYSKYLVPELVLQSYDTFNIPQFNKFPHLMLSFNYPKSEQSQSGFEVFLRVTMKSLPLSSTGFLVHSLILKMDTICSLEMSGSLHVT
jgi:hypothetical protein